MRDSPLRRAVRELTEVKAADSIEGMHDGLIDLHLHTLCSDGSASPSELVASAASKGARAIAITDHDNLAGLAEGREAAVRASIELIDGVEISADYQPGTMHILGYYIDPSSPTLSGALADLRRAREERNPQIAERLRTLGFNVTMTEVAQLAGSEVVGRPHFAKLMVSRGYVSTIKEAFDRYLAKGSPAYVEKRRLDPRESIELIHSAGGAAVLAHPYQMKLSWEDTEAKVRELAEYGLDGIEAIYSRHSPDERDRYSALAARLGLVITGGSDYHGTYKPDIEVVTGTGDLKVPYSVLGPLRARAKGRGSNTA
ncbi:MAG TPA: PHP domain-containing protein [Blastocatellia bacterium]|nr:PHP domain-containing protein [Blastocatellia bacterium]